MSHSRGDLTTKIHALVDAMVLPIMLKLTEGQATDGRSAAADLFDTIGTISDHHWPVARNVIDQDFAAAGPDQKLGVDISYISTRRLAISGCRH